MTLKAAARRPVRSALMPLARRHRVDRMFEPNRLSGIFATDTMDMRCDSMHDERCCQVFANKDFFAAACPTEKKGDACEPVDLFAQDCGAPDTLISDGAKEQVGRNSKFQAKLGKHGVKHKTSEKERPNQNPSEGTIREVRKRWHRQVLRTNCPRRLWNCGLPHVCAVMRLTASCAGRLQGRTPLEAMTGETPDISECLDFGFCDLVWFKENAGLGEMQLGRFLGVDHSVGSLMGCKVLTRSGMPVSRTTAQRVTELEKSTEANKARITSHGSAMAERFKEERLAKNGDKPDPAAWVGVIETDADFAEEFANPFDNPDAPEADDEFDPDSFDTHLNMGLVLDRRPGAEPEFAWVTKRLRDKHGNPIGKANDNPMLDTRLHEVEHLDGHKAALSANIIAESIMAQVDSEGHRELLMDEIIGHPTDGNEAQESDAFVEAKNGVKRRVHTTVGWEINMLWRDGTTTWSKLKDVKESCPVQVAECTAAKDMSHLPAFQWWVPHTPKKRDRIIAKTKTSCWQKTHKHGLEAPKNYQDCVRIDVENGNRSWQDAVRDEMKTARPAFETHEGAIQDLIGCQKISCHLVFDVKLGENFQRKARCVAGGHMTHAPSALTCSSVVSRDSVRIALTVAALNDLDMLACDIEGACLTAKCRERICVKAGPEFGSEQDSVMIVKIASIQFNSTQ
jgi:hypothetical protein